MRHPPSHSPRPLTHHQYLPSLPSTHNQNLPFSPTTLTHHPPISPWPTYLISHPLPIPNFHLNPRTIHHRPKALHVLQLRSFTISQGTPISHLYHILLVSLAQYPVKIASISYNYSSTVPVFQPKTYMLHHLTSILINHHPPKSIHPCPLPITRHTQAST